MTHYSGTALVHPGRANFALFEVGAETAAFGYLPEALGLNSGSNKRPLAIPRHAPSLL
jgi:hypothetical protein